jgi:hypothetical protein
MSENDPVPRVRIPPPVIATFIEGAAHEACKARIGRWL